MIVEENVRVTGGGEEEWLVVGVGWVGCGGGRGGGTPGAGRAEVDLVTRAAVVRSRRERRVTPARRGMALTCRDAPGGRTGGSCRWTGTSCPGPGAECWGDLRRSKRSRWAKRAAGGPNVRAECGGQISTTALSPPAARRSSRFRSISESSVLVGATGAGCAPPRAGQREPWRPGPGSGLRMASGTAGHRTAGGDWGRDVDPTADVVARKDVAERACGPATEGGARPGKHALPSSR